MEDYKPKNGMNEKKFRDIYTKYAADLGRNKTKRVKSDDKLDRTSTDVEEQKVSD